MCGQESVSYFKSHPCLEVIPNRYRFLRDHLVYGGYSGGAMNKHGVCACVVYLGGFTGQKGSGRSCVTID